MIFKVRDLDLYLFFFLIRLSLFHFHFFAADDLDMASPSSLRFFLGSVVAVFLPQQQFIIIYVEMYIGVYTLCTYGRY